MSSEDTTIRAAGGVVLRGFGPETEIVIVHRPRYGDWTIPKGKLDAGESHQMAALREVAEETGLQCRILGTAGTARYEVNARPKEVRYYLMRPFRFVGFEPNSEVDETRWVILRAAAEILTYHFDRELVAAASVTERPASAGIHLVRHAAAGDRAEWTAQDHDRPLTPRGRRQAEGLGAGLADVGVRRLLSSSYLRCVQTAAPLAEATGLDIEVHPALGEGASPSSIGALLDEVAGTETALFSHGDVIPDALRLLRGRGVEFLSPMQCQKASTWSVGWNDDGYTDAVYVGPPPS